MQLTTLPVAANDSRTAVLKFLADSSLGTPGVYSPSWDTACDHDGNPDTPTLGCDPVGAGLLQADSALAAVTSP